MHRLRAATHLIQHAVQLVARLADAIAVVAVDHEDQTLCVLEIVPPQRADLRRGRAEGGMVGRQRCLTALHPCSCLHAGLHQTAPGSLCTLSWPPTSHTVKLMFLYSTVSTLKPVVKAR